MDFKVPLKCNNDSGASFPSVQIPNNECRVSRRSDREARSEDERQIRRRSRKLNADRSVSNSADSDSKLPTNSINEDSRVKWWLEGIPHGASAVSNNDLEAVTNFVSESLRKDVVIDKSVNDIVYGLQKYRVEAERESSHHICGRLTALRSPSKSMDFNNKGLQRFSFLVLDTTIFMSHLHFITDIMNSDIAMLFPGQLFLLLPWVVLKELDGLCSGLAFDFEWQRLARRAAEFLEDAFVSGKSLILTESVSDALSGLSSNKPETLTTTAQIIHCCKRYKNIGKVALLSNDRALCQAARSRKVHGTCIERLPILLEKWFPNSGPRVPKEVAFVKERETYQGILQDVKQILMPFLEMFVMQEMRNVYGQRSVTPSWKEVVDVLRFIETHWSKVFAGSMRKTAKIHLDLMINKFKITAEFINSSTVKSLVIESCRFLKNFELKSEYYNLAMPIVNNLTALNGPNDQGQFVIATSQPVPGKIEISSPSNENSPENEMVVIQNLFNAVWESIKTLCCCLCKCCGLTIPSEEEKGNYDKFKRPYDFLPIFYPTITEIRDLIQRVLHIRPSLEEKDETVYCKLCSALENYFVRLGLMSDTHNVDEINPEMMRKFCLDSETRMLVKQGLIVLEECCQRSFLCILTIKDCCVHDIIDDDE